MGLFGKPKQLKNLERKLTAAQMSFKLFARLRADNQQHFLDTAPREIAEAVAGAVRAGHAAPAKAMLEGAASRIPTGATEEQWQDTLSSGFAQLP